MELWKRLGNDRIARAMNVSITQEKGVHSVTQAANGGLLAAFLGH